MGTVERGAPELPFSLTKLSIGGEVRGSIDLPRHESDGSGIFSVATHHAWSPLGYLIVGRNDTYSLSAGVTRGDTLKVGREFDPVTVGADERQEWQAYWDYREKQARQRGQLTQYSAVPATKPVFRGLLVGDDGRIWVHRHVQAEKRDVAERSLPNGSPVISWLEPLTYDVFEPDGAFLGTVVLPEDTSLHAMRGQHLWLVARTDEGERVVRMKIVRSTS